MDWRVCARTPFNFIHAVGNQAREPTARSERLPLCRLPRERGSQGQSLKETGTEPSRGEQEIAMTVLTSQASTHDRLQSFLDGADDSEFPLENLPWGVFSTADKPEPRVGVGLGHYVVDLGELAKSALVWNGAPISQQEALELFSRPKLNAYLALPKDVHRSVRTFLQDLLSKTNPVLQADRKLQTKAFVLVSDAKLHLPIEVGDYTDFCASEQHSANAGRIIFNNPDRPLDENWYTLPIGYHGRSSSIIVSGQDFHRPNGILKDRKTGHVSFGPSKVMDYELEFAFIIGGGSPMDNGQPIPVSKAEYYIFGAVLMNDWSARDIQGWEMVPLGPFAGKNFATTISPWVVELAALEPFRVPAPVQSREPLPHLHEHGMGTLWDIQLKAHMRKEGEHEWTFTTDTNLKYLYWTHRQMVAHHTAGGCQLRPGDLLASGTVTGPVSS